MTILEEAQRQFEHHLIAQQSGFEQRQCACNKCQQMCKTAPCIGTPLDILAICEAGYANRLYESTILTFIKHGYPPYDVIAPKFDRIKGACTFLTTEGLCELHTRGLKPIEGKIAYHADSFIRADKYPVALLCGTLFSLDEQKPILDKINKLMSNV